MSLIWRPSWQDLIRCWLVHLLIYVRARSGYLHPCQHDMRYKWASAWSVIGYRDFRLEVSAVTNPIRQIPALNERWTGRGRYGPLVEGERTYHLLLLYPCFTYPGGSLLLDSYTLVSHACSWLLRSFRGVLEFTRLLIQWINSTPWRVHGAFKYWLHWCRTLDMVTNTVIRGGMINKTKSAWLLIQRLNSNSWRGVIGTISFERGSRLRVNT